MRRRITTSEPYVTAGGTAVLEITTTRISSAEDGTHAEVVRHYLVLPVNAPPYPIDGTLKDAIIEAESRCAHVQIQASTANTRPKLSVTYRTTLRRSSQGWIDQVDTVEDATETAGVSTAQTKFVLTAGDGTERAFTTLGDATSMLDQMDAAAVPHPRRTFQN